MLLEINGRKALIRVFQNERDADKYVVISADSDVLVNVDNYHLASF